MILKLLKFSFIIIRRKRNKLRDDYKMTRRIEVTAKTVEEAVEKALKEKTEAGVYPSPLFA